MHDARAARNAIDVAIGLGCSYADVRVIEQQKQMIRTKDLSVAGLNLTESLGLGVRVLFQGGWGFASTQSLTTSGITRAAKTAVAVAKASATCVNPPIELAAEPAHRTSWHSPCLIDPFTISLAEKIDLLLDCAKTILAVKGISLAQGEMTFTKEKKLFVSSDGSEIAQTFVRSSCGIEANAFSADERQRRSYPNSFGGQSENAGWELVDKWQLQKHAQRIAEEAVALLDAPRAARRKRRP